MMIERSRQLFRRVRRSFSESEFNRNVGKLFTGAAVSAAISFLTIPILTRLYAPQDFGNFQTLLSIVAIIAVVSALKYEMAIVLPRRRAESHAVAALSVILVIATTVVLAVAFWLGGDRLLAYVNASELHPYWPIICLIVLMRGTTLVLNKLLLSDKAFGRISMIRIGQTVTSKVFAVGWGLRHPSFLGLVLSEVAAMTTGILMMLRRGLRVREGLNSRRIRAVASTYRKFPLVNTLSVFLNTLAMHLPVFMFSRYLSPEFIGIYTVTLRLVERPLGMITGATSKVYFQAAAEARIRGPQDLLDLYRSTQRKLFALAAIIGVTVFVASPLMPLLLGDGWSEVSLAIRIILFWKIAEFLNVPISTTFEVIDRQEVGLYLRIASLAARFGGLYLFRHNSTHMLIALSVTAGLYYVSYNLLVYWNVKSLARQP